MFVCAQDEKLWLVICGIARQEEASRSSAEEKRASKQGQGGSGGGVGDEVPSTLRVENVGTSTLAKVVTMRLPDAGGGEG